MLYCAPQEAGSALSKDTILEIKNLQDFPNPKSALRIPKFFSAIRKWQPARRSLPKADGSTPVAAQG
jgi:hypothetical protein